MNCWIVDARMSLWSLNNFAALEMLLLLHKTSLVLRATTQQARNSAQGHLPLGFGFALHRIGASIPATSLNILVSPIEIQMRRRSPKTTARRPPVRAKTMIPRVRMQAQVCCITLPSTGRPLRRRSRPTATTAICSTSKGRWLSRYHHHFQLGT